MLRFRIVLFASLSLTTFALLFTSCSDDPAQPQRPPMDFLVGVEITLADAVAQAIPGDTITLVGGDSLTATQVIPSNKTPLLFRALVLHDPLLRGPDDQPILRFESPAEGTRIAGIFFRGGSSSLVVEGEGHLKIWGCGFRDGDVQVLVDGGSFVEIVESVMDDAGTFAIQAMNGARIVSSNNTIVNAGDCGILLTGSSTGRVDHCILHDSVNFGIACTGGGSLDPDSGCNDIYSNVGGSSPYLGCTGSVGDFSLDPGFCDEENRYYRLAETSPCTELNSPGGCGLVGAIPDGCN